MISPGLVMANFQSGRKRTKQKRRKTNTFSPARTLQSAGLYIFFVLFYVRVKFFENGRGLGKMNGKYG
jgi:hypothetical protein